jgi:succinate--hydroxymethylglutarate CoA-transferase
MLASLPMDAATNGEFKMIGIPVKFSKTKPAIRTPPPVIGEHTRDILASIGREEEIDELYMDKVI